MGSWISRPKPTLCERRGYQALVIETDSSKLVDDPKYSLLTNPYSRRKSAGSIMSERDMAFGVKRPSFRFKKGRKKPARQAGKTARMPKTR
jgi:hypothetical protein